MQCMTVNINASNTGKGGKIITFAKNTARIYGKLSARGGVNGGNGGFIETSGLQGFDISRAPDVSAVLGVGGQWLIDPFNITIVKCNNKCTTNIGTVNNSFASMGTPAKLRVKLITKALKNGDVTITTGTGAGVGNITFLTDLDYKGTGKNNILTLNAANTIDINGFRIYDSGGKGKNSLNLIFNAGGNIQFADALIETNGGSFLAKGVNFTSLDTTGDTRFIDTAGGAVTLTMTGNINVGAKIISKGGKVTLTGTGAASAVTISGAGINTASGALTINTTGAITATNAPLIIGGTTTITNKNAAIQLDNANNAFTGTVSLNSDAGNVTINNNTNPLDFGSSQWGTSKVTATAAGLTQSGAISSLQTGSAIFNAGGNKINLNDPSNNLLGTVSLNNSGTNVVTLNNKGALTLTTSTVGDGTMTITAASIAQAGAITQTANGNGAVSLNTLGTKQNATIKVNKDIQFGKSTLSGNLDVTAGAGGLITLVGLAGAGITVTDTATFRLDNQRSIVLNNNDNAFNKISFLANPIIGKTTSLQNVTVNNSTVLDLQALTITGDLAVKANGIINTSGNIIVKNGLTTLDAGTGDIMLNNAQNDFKDIVIVAANNATLNDSNTINFSNNAGTISTISGKLTVTTTGDMTQTDALNATIADFTTSGTGQIILESTNNNFGTLNVSSTNTVKINDRNAITLGNITITDTTTTTGTFTHTTGGAINDTTSSTINVTGLTTLLAGNNDINLRSGTHDFSNVVFTGNAVTLKDENKIILGQTGAIQSTATALTVIANGALTDNASSVTVSGNANLNSDSSDIDMKFTDFQGAVSAKAKNTIRIKDATALTVATMSAATTINLTADSISGVINSNDRLRSSRVNLVSANGINNIKTATATLQASNTRSGIVKIDNVGNVLLERLANTGSTGDITFTNDLNIIVKQNSVYANYDSGRLRMTTQNGNFLAVGAPSINNADITAFSATFLGRNALFGTRVRPIVLNLKEFGNITVARPTTPILTPPGPRLGIIYGNNSPRDYIINAERLIEIEELEDIDPAIFTDVRNYTYGQIAIRLPDDQLFDDDDD